MRCSFLPIFNNNYSGIKQNPQINYSPSFCGNSPEKLIKYVLGAFSPKKTKIRFDEAVKIYNYLGYDVIFRSGSHAQIVIGDSHLPLVMPHKDKVITAMDVKRLKYVIQGEIDKALQVNGC